MLLHVVGVCGLSFGFRYDSSVMHFFVKFGPFLFFLLFLLRRRGWLLWLCVEVEIEDVAVLDLLFERGSDISLQLGLSALAEGHHVVRVDVKLV